jgi:non-heme chloroperoxidase
MNVLGNNKIQDSWNIAAGASPIGTWQCISAWLTDFRKDLACFDVPTLIFHGDSDRTLPLSCGQATHALVKGSRLVIVKDGPHVLAPFPN